MAVIKAFAGALGGTFADLWRDIITAGPFTEHTVVVPGIPRGSNNDRGSNEYGSEGIITNGSRIYVPENTAAVSYTHLVVNGDGRLVGFVSDGDVMKSIATYEYRTVSTGTGSTMVVFDDETVASKVQALSGKKVMDIATRKVVAATPDQHVGEVARILAKKQFKKLPVVDGDGRLVGVIRRKSVMEHAFDALFPQDDR